MSDINEEQKRLYKRAEEFDKKYNKYLQKELAEANNRINKAIEYINNILEQFEKLPDKELLTNRCVDIEVIKEIKELLEEL